MGKEETRRSADFSDVHLKNYNNLLISFEDEYKEGLHTESIRCIITWKATKATIIQSNHSGSSALFSLTAKNMVTTKINVVILQK